jgi:hypothetical protein
LVQFSRSWFWIAFDPSVIFNLFDSLSKWNYFQSFQEKVWIHVRLNPQLQEQASKVLYRSFDGQEDAICSDSSCVVQVWLFEGSITLSYELTLYYLVCWSKTSYLGKKIQNRGFQRMHDNAVQLSHDSVHRLLFWQQIIIYGWRIIPGLHSSNCFCQRLYCHPLVSWKLQEKEVLR